jgi:long-chain acyl-CoA synthetase
LRRTLADWFTEFADLPDPYLVHDNGYRSWSYTYAQLGAAARTFAARLRAEGIGKGEKVILWSENRPEWIAAFWGCVLSGVVVVPIDYRSSSDLLRRVETLVSPRVIVIGDEIQLPPSAARPLVWRMSEIEWPSTGPDALPVPLDPDDVAEIVFTSGATGDPKGVLITHRNILSNLTSPERLISQYVRWFRPVFPLRFLCLVPLSHMFGQALTMFVLPLLPGVGVFMRGYSPAEIIRQVRSRRISVIAAVPKMLEALRDHILLQFPEAAQPSLPGSHWTRRWWQYRRIHRHFGWKFWAFISGAAPLNADIEEFWSKLGFAVIQGYGLTETAPIVAFNNPFATKKGTVGRPVAGTEIKIAADGEILVRGESVTPGYFGVPPGVGSVIEEGWLHTGDIGEFDVTGSLVIRGRKKEVIVTPDGLKVFPEDVERALNAVPGVSESAVVGKERPHAVLVLAPGVSAEDVIRQANETLEAHQRIRGVSVWTGQRLPRTVGTGKLKRTEILRWVEQGGLVTPPAPTTPQGDLLNVVRKYAPGRAITEQTTLDQLGLSSLDRVELMIDLEQNLDTSVDEAALSGTRPLGELVRAAAPGAPIEAEIPHWSRRWLSRSVRKAALLSLLLPLTRLFAWTKVRGLEHLTALKGPVIFASNHQSHMDTPVILWALPARFRYRVGVAMWKEFFDAHFHPERHAKSEWLGNSLLYSVVTLFFNAFPLPVTEAGARGSLRHIGDLVSDGWSVLYFPEGSRTDAGAIGEFQPGIGLIASRLGVPVVPIRLRGLEKVLHRDMRFPQPGHVEITFGPALHLKGDDYRSLSQQVEQAVRAL